jgi:hypothetical protein
MKTELNASGRLGTRLITGKQCLYDEGVVR